MADYIKSNILFESYVHVDAEFDSASDAHEHIRRQLSDYISVRASHFLYEDVDAEVNFKEGSIKVYATVRGSLVKSLGIFDDFSVAINRLFWFSKRLSDASVVEVTFLTGSYLGAIERTEARPGVIGQTKRIVDTVLSVYKPETEKDALAVIRSIRLNILDCINLFKALQDPEDIKLVKSELLKLIQNNPKNINHLKVSEESQSNYKKQQKEFNSLLDGEL